MKNVVEGSIICWLYWARYRLVKLLNSWLRFWSCALSSGHPLYGSACSGHWLRGFNCTLSWIDLDACMICSDAFVKANRCLSVFVICFVFIRLSIMFKQFKKQAVDKKAFRIGKVYKLFSCKFQQTCRWRSQLK